MAETTLPQLHNAILNLDQVLLIRIWQLKNGASGESAAILHKKTIFGEVSALGAVFLNEELVEVGETKEPL